MKISYQWVNRYCGLDLSVEAMVESLTLLGLEATQQKPQSPIFNNVVVAKIKEAKQHPNADRLKICQVFDGQQNYHIVCGAPNARVGIKVAFAKIGALLPNNFKIKATKIRGEVSHGMLCSARELGLGDDSSGIMELPEDAPIGEDLRTYKNLDDVIVDIELTPNRGDCFSLRGIARELCAQQNVSFTDFTLLSHPIEHTDKIDVSLNTPNCQIFSGCLAKNVDCHTATPEWMVDILASSNIRSVNLMVDITNYVMLLVGQPMHAYDADILNDHIEVRNALSTDTLTLLDKSQPKLTEDMLLIVSKTGAEDSHVVGLAGIMGAANCGVSANTKNVYFEAAHFTPQYSLGKARRLGMQTEASTRFERGVDPSMVQIAISHACDLLKQTTTGQLGEMITTYHPSYQAYLSDNTPTTTLSLAQIKQVLGVDMELSFVHDTLQKINIPCRVKDAQSVQLTSPIHRFDLTITEDYCEELARHYGYENILQHTHTSLQLPPVPISHKQGHSQKKYCKQHLSSLGLNETISYCFVNDDKQKQLFPGKVPCRLLNPISSDMNVMRLSLLPNLLANIAYNNHHQKTSVALFEMGLCFTPNEDNPRHLDDIQQKEKLAFVINNQWRSRHWRGDKKVDFYIIKGIFTSLMNRFCVRKIDYKTEQLPVFMHPGQSAIVFHNGKKIGIIGMLHPLTLDAFDIRDPVGFCELDWSLIETQQKKTKYQPFTVYPRVYRDLSILIKQNISVQQLTLAINSWKIKYLSDMEIVDLYQGERINSEMKSVTMCFQFESFKETLAEENINQSFNKIQENLTTQLGVEIRNKQL